jgi:Translation initiation factor IF-2, N-terminal region
MRIRVSQIAGELRCKSDEILGVLPELGITRTGAITHNTSLDADETDKVRQHFAANPNLKEPRANSRTLGLVKSIAARFGEEV